MPRVSVNVGYFRNWCGNWYVVDNRATPSVGLHAVQHHGAARSRGCRTAAARSISGLYNLVPDKVGQVDELAQSSNNFGEQTENWQGVDVNVVARLRSGLTVQGGHEHRAPARGRLRGAGEVAGARTGPDGSDEQLHHGERHRVRRRHNGSRVTSPYCRIDEPYLTQFRGLATYTIPKVDVQVSGTWASIPGDSLAANYVVTNAISQPGRSRSAAISRAAPNVTVNLIEPATLFADRRNNIDFRVAKILRYGRTRTQVGLDIYNLTNTDVATGYNQTYLAHQQRVADADERFSRRGTPGSARSSTSETGSRLKAYGSGPEP